MRILPVLVLCLALPASAAEPKAKLEVPEKLVLALAYSPDGKTLASSGSWVRGRDVEIQLWDTTTNKELKVLKVAREPGDQVECMQFSPDGNMLCTGPTPRFWDLKTGKAIDFIGANSATGCVSFDSDGKTVVTTSDDNTIRIWNVNTRKEQARITEGSGCAYFTPDGKTLVYGTGTRGGTIKLWDYTTGKEKAAIKAEADQVNHLACTNDTIAYYSTVRQGTGWLTTVHLMDFTGKELHRLKGHDSYLMALAFTTDGRFLATASADKSVRLWDVKTGKQLAVYPAGDCWTLAISPDGKTLATGTREKTIKLWDISELTKKRPKATIKVDEGWILSLAYSPDGKSLASGNTFSAKKDYKVHLWDTATNKELKVFTGHPGPIEAVKFSPDGKFLASLSGDIFLWDVATGKQTLLKSPRGFVAFAFKPDSKTVATAGNSVQIWDLTGKELTRINIGSRTVEFTADGTTLVYGAEKGVVKFWDIATSKEGKSLKHKMDISTLLAVSGDTLATSGHIRAQSGDVCKILLWDIPSGKELEPLEGDPSLVYTLSFSANGKMIAAFCHDDKVRVWDVGSRKLVASVDSNAFALALSPDGKWLATSDTDQTIKIWDIAEKK